MSNDPIIDPISPDAWGDAIPLDVRPQPDFAAGRLVNAVHVPVEEWERKAKEPGFGFENTSFWEAAIAELGVNGERPVVVYDDGRLTEAARVWFILQHFGVPVRLLNGGWPALKQLAGLAVETGPASPDKPAAFRARSGAGNIGLMDRDEVKGALGSSTQIFDARTAAEFTGEDLRKNARGGHVPGAVHLAHADLLDDAGRLRASAELRSLLEQAGFRSSSAVVTHCDGGGRAALAAIAALRAGYPDVRVYYLSFADWARDESCPISR